MPHCAHEELLLFENQGDGARQEVDGASQQVQLLGLPGQVTVLSGTIIAHLDSLYKEKRLIKNG